MSAGDQLVVRAAEPAPAGGPSALLDDRPAVRTPEPFPTVSRSQNGHAAGRPPDQLELSRRQRLIYGLLTVLWIVVNAQFWVWWWPRAQDGSGALPVVVTAALAYQACVLPSMFWYFIARMRRPRHRPAPTGLRVAVVTLCVPSAEAIDVIEAQLRALSEIRYPHDSWILDEGNSMAVRRLAADYGVRYFTREGIPRWNQPGPPHQRATKAGNVNAWLAFLRESGIEYEAFVQLDLDHHPVPQYLHRVLGHLDDPEVAWVQAPSVCGNLDVWTARGLAEQDVVLQGPLQMGFYGASSTPFIVGSHTTYRMSAVREIGGFQPTRAEDHLDTVLLAAHGYRGIYVPEIIATGDGPTSYATYLRQQFAWAHSMITVLFAWTPRLLHRYRPAQAVQFLFAQTWYVLWSCSLLALWAAPPVALLSGEQIAATTLPEYVVYFVPVALVGWLMWCFARPFFAPAGVGISWRGAVLTVGRWPVVLWALVSVVLRIERPYMITPKPGRTQVRLPRVPGLMVYGPLLMLSATAIAAAAIAEELVAIDPQRSYLLLVLVNALVPLVAAAVTVSLEIRDIRRAGASFPGAVARRWGVVVVLLALTAALALAAENGWTDIAQALA